jgi:multiple sugar transport system permease protein
MSLSAPARGTIAEWYFSAPALSEYGTWWRIIVPLSTPAIASLGLRTFIDQYNADYALIFTGSVLSVLPIAIIFMLGQRYFVEGVATTGLKG